MQNPLQRIVTTVAELEVLEARLDGRATEFTLAPVPGGERISVGPEIVVSKRPSHSFQIVYRLRDAVTFGEAVDGFSWNVTGSGWTIPIQRARAVVHQPRVAVSSLAIGALVFAAALLNIAVKGHVALHGGSKGDYAATRTGAGTAALSPDEEVVARELFAEAGVVKLAGANHGIIVDAIFAHWDKLKATHGGRYFQHNHRYLAPGLMMSALIAAVLVVLAGDRENAFYASVAAVFVGLLCFAFASGAVEHWREGHRRTGIEGALFSLVSFAVAVAALGWLASSASIPAAALLLAVFVTSLFFYFSIKAPTAEGRALMDRIAGFRHYLLVAEKERLDLLNPPEETPEVFERYLPYAVALDAEQAWGAHFADALLSPLLEGLEHSDEAGRPARPELVGSSLAAALEAVDRAGRSASPAPPGRRPAARR